MKLVKFLFLFFLFFLPHTRLSVPAFLMYELTLSDISLLFLFFVAIVFIKRIKKAYSAYMCAFVLFLFFITLSFPNALSAKYFISDLVPYVFSTMIIISAFTFFSQDSKTLRLLLEKIFKIIYITVFMTVIPVYIQLFTGNKLLYFYDSFGWRYTFLCQNPNQFGVFSILYTMLLTIMSLVYYPNRLKYVFLLFLIFIPAALFSGSKTVALIFGINFLLVAFILFLRSSNLSKILISPIFLIGVVLLGPAALNTLKTKGGQINRALTIFDAIGEKGASGVKVGGDSGDSMDEAIRLFLDHPFTGVGLANKPMYSPVVTEIHNTYLKMLAETGIIGVVGFIVIFFLPFVTFIASKKNLLSKAALFLFYLLFASMNWPHMLFRQRWVWFFMVMIFVIARVDKNGNMEKSKLAFLN